MKMALVQAALLAMLPLGFASRKAPAPAAAPGPAPVAAMSALALTFEIANYNYIDLDDLLHPAPATKQQQGEKGADGGAAGTVSMHWANSNVGKGLARYAEAAGSKVADTTSDVAEAGADTTWQNADHVSDHTKRTSVHAHRHSKKAADASHRHFKVSVDAAHGGVTDTAEQIRATTKSSFLQARTRSHRVRTHTSLEALVRDVLRDTIHDTVEEIVEHFLPIANPPAAAPAADTAAFLGESSGPAPAPAPAQPEHKFDVFVQFGPGSDRPLAGVEPSTRPAPYGAAIESSSEFGKATLVEVTITGTPETGVDEMPSVMAALNVSKKDGELGQLLAGALYEATGLVPKIEGLKFGPTKVEQWTVECESHMQKVVKFFTMAYTRRMVPTAIYNECTNYVPFMSFSHDHIPNVHDKNRCREATIKFTKHWDFGKDASGKSASEVFGPFCVDVCEAKYGAGAQQCHVDKGDQLMNKDH